jgi:hypothetical protein
MSKDYDNLLGKEIPMSLVPHLRDSLRVPLHFNFRTLSVELNRVRWPALHPEIKKAVAELLDKEVASA